MGFFRDLFSPLQPCDLCQLGHSRPITGSAATSDWRIQTPGLEVGFVICGRCRRAIQDLHLQDKYPLVTMTTLIARRMIAGPPPEAFLAHPGWRRVVFHTFNLRGAVPESVDEQLQLLKSIESDLIERISVEPAHSAEPTSSLDVLETVHWRMTKTEVRGLFKASQALPPHPTQNAIGFAGVLCGLPATMVFYFTWTALGERLVRLAASFFDEPQRDAVIRSSFEIVMQEVVKRFGEPGHSDFQHCKTQPPEARMSQWHVWRIVGSILVIGLGMSEDGVPEGRCGIYLTYGDVGSDPLSKVWDWVRPSSFGSIRCPHCAAVLRDDAKYCRGCGRAL